jgi:hypothetical protein
MRLIVWFKLKNVSFYVIVTFASDCIQRENVKNPILHAMPIDIEKEKMIIENWTAHLNADNLVDALGNI